MANPEQHTHEDLLGETIEAQQVRTAGSGSSVHNEHDIRTLRNDRDDRRKTVLINKDLIPAAGDLLVDVVTYPPGEENGRHYHEDTDHFFYILEGRGTIEIEGEAFPLEPGTIVWLGEGDAHKVNTHGSETSLKILEYYSNNDHTATRVEDEDEGHTWVYE